MTTVAESRFDYDIDPITLNEDMSNKLFCTFATEETLEPVLENIQERYNIIYNKIFVLYSKSLNEYICTYNVDFGRNCVLLTKGPDLKRINTKLYKIIEL